MKSDRPVILVDGDGGVEGFGFWFERISGVGDGGVGVRDCPSTPGSPSDVATGVAAGSWDLGATVSGFPLRRVGGEGSPSQPLFSRSKISCDP